LTNTNGYVSPLFRLGSNEKTNLPAGSKDDLI